MSGTLRSIQPLLETVCRQIKSSIQITTLSDAVVELFTNSLDANAKAVAIVVDFAKGFCCVEDDGEGIPAFEFGTDGNLARLNSTSKLDAPHCYGRHGRFLSYLASLSLVSISSIRKDEGSARAVLLGPSVPSKQMPCDTPDLGAQGTKVVVRNLFGNLPVRFKHLALQYSAPSEEEKEFESLKSRLVAYLLSSDKLITLRLRSSDGRLKYTHRSTRQNETVKLTFSLEHIESTVRQAGLVNPADVGRWKLASAKAGGLSVRAAICMSPSPSRLCQFFSLGQVPILNRGVGAFFYDAVNAAFESSQFGSAADIPAPTTVWPSTKLASECRQSSLRTKIVKGVGRWPRFYIRVDAKSDALQNDMVAEQITDQLLPELQEVLDLLWTFLEQFLRAQELQPKARRRVRSNDSNLPDLRHSQSANARHHPHNSWRRSKHSYHFSKDDVHHNLPFIGRPIPSIDELLLCDDARLLLEDMEIDPEALEASADSSTLLPDQSDPGFVGHEDNELQNTTSWTDSRTGKLVKVNLDNGFVLPPSVAGSASTIIQDATFIKQRPRKLPQKPRIDLSERLKSWPSGAFPSQREQSIPSTILHGDLQAEVSAKDIIDQTIGKRDLKDATVLSQVDRKFILCVVATVRGPPALLVIDQHAADERIKVEYLYEKLCTCEVAPLAIPIKFQVSRVESARFEERQQEFAKWAILYNLSGSNTHQEEYTVSVTHLPATIAERCRLEPKLLIDLLRIEIWSPTGSTRHISTLTNDSWLSKMSACPKGLVEMANSRACRTAIMFNDVLSNALCAALLKRLSECTLPFQCAHGRPSMTILASLGYAHTGNGAVPEFGEAYRDWCSY